MAALLVATAVRPDAQIFAEPPADTTSAGSDLPAEDDEGYVVDFDGTLPAVCQGGLAQPQSDACALAMEVLAPDPILISDEISEIVDCSGENILSTIPGFFQG